MLVLQWWDYDTGGYRVQTTGYRLQATDTLLLREPELHHHYVHAQGYMYQPLPLPGVILLGGTAGVNLATRHATHGLLNKLRKLKCACLQIHLGCWYQLSGLPLPVVWGTGLAFRDFPMFLPSLSLCLSHSLSLSVSTLSCETVTSCRLPLRVRVLL